MSNTGNAVIVPATADVIKLDENRVDYFPLSMFTIAEGYNLRMFDAAADADDKLFLGQVIAAGRINTPLVCRIVNGKVEVMEGHRRYFAACEAERSGAVRPFPNLPVRGAPEGMSEVARTYDLFVSNSGKPLTPIERARGVKRLADAGEKRAAIAARCGISTEWIARMLQMAAMPEYLAQAVYAGNIGSTLASDMVREAPTKGFDVKTLWDKASAKARESVKFDATTGRYVWVVTQKTLDIFLAEMGTAMDKSRIKRAPGGQTNQTESTQPKDAPKDGQDAPKDGAADASKDAPKDAPKDGAEESEDESEDGQDGRKVATKTGAEMPAPKSNGATRKPDETAHYKLGKDGITILDRNGARILIAEDMTTARDTIAILARAARDLSLSVTLRPLQGSAPVRPAMTPEQLAAAKDAMERAEAANGAMDAAHNIAEASAEAPAPDAAQDAPAADVTALIPADAVQDAPAPETAQDAPAPAPKAKRAGKGRKLAQAA